MSVTQIQMQRYRDLSGGRTSLKAPYTRKCRFHFSLLETIQKRRKTFPCDVCTGP